MNTKLNIRRANERGHADHGWLNAWHTFSFANYYDPAHMGYRTLRVINDDTIAPGGGFGAHPHRDMEIITYILDGELEHKDSMGNGRVIKTGEVQYMAAGTGVTHSEFNASEKHGTHLLQIWIQPDQKGAKPRYEEKSLAKAKTGVLHLVASKAGRDHSIAINQDADLFLARLEPGQSVEHTVRPRRNAWLHVAEGAVEVNGEKLNAGDAVSVSEEGNLKLTAKEKSQVLLFDLN